MPTTPEDRQLAIDAYTEAIVNTGLMDDTEATEFATKAIDGAIAEQDS